VQVRGYADQRLRKPDQLEDPSNRRISLIVQSLIKEADKAEDETKSKEGSPKEAAPPQEEHR
jgi:hypothetical protein